MYLNEDLFIEFLNQREILWTGINFSLAKLTKKGFEYPQDVLQYYFNGWNTATINNQKKYDIRLSFQKPIMHYDLSLVTKLNKNTKASHLLTDVIAHQDIHNEDQIREYISSLSVESKVPFGLTFIVEYFDSNSKRASIWVVIFKTGTMETVLAENFLLKPSGFGTSNYWGRTFYDILFEIKTSAFLRWKNMVQQRIAEQSGQGH